MLEAVQSAGVNLEWFAILALVVGPAVKVAYDGFPAFPRPGLSPWLQINSCY